MKDERKEECPSFGLSNWRDKVTLVETGKRGKNKFGKDGRNLVLDVVKLRY